MKPKTMILMGLAIVCGLGASYMTSRLLADRGNDEKETVKVLVAKQNLSIGTPIRKPEELFEEKVIPKDADQPDAIREFDQLKDKVLKQSRNKGETVTITNLLGKNETLDVPDGHGAYGLRVSLETSASGLSTLPGSRVNLIWYQRGRDNETSRSDYLFEDVLVLAADGKVDRESLTAVAQVVTLALTPTQAVRVDLAKNTGILSLELRKHGSHDKQYVEGILGEDLRREIAMRNKETDKGPDPYPKEAPKVTENVPQIAAKPVEKPKVEDQPPAAPLKTTKSEFTIIQANRIEIITREIAEDGTIVSETRRVQDLAPAQQAPPTNSKKQQPSQDI